MNKIVALITLIVCLFNVSVLGYEDIYAESAYEYGAIYEYASESPTKNPVRTKKPTARLTKRPTKKPTRRPTKPTKKPTKSPTLRPTRRCPRKKKCPVMTCPPTYTNETTFAPTPMNNVTTFN